MRASPSWPHYLPMVLPPNTISVGDKISTYGFRGDSNIQTIAEVDFNKYFVLQERREEDAGCHGSMGRYVQEKRGNLQIDRLIFILWKMRQDYLQNLHKLRNCWFWMERWLIGKSKEISRSTEDLTKTRNHNFKVRSISMVMEPLSAILKPGAEAKGKNGFTMSPQSGDENYPGRKPTPLVC